VTAASVFAKKEAREIARTWRIWVLPGIVLFIALSGPLLARFTPQIIGAVAGNQLGHLTLPPATYLDAYGQWVKNLGQIVIVALIVIYGGIVSAETNSGTAVLVLTKPVSRGAFVVVKAVVHAVFLAVLLAAGTLVTWATTAVVFGTAPGAALWSASLLWLTLAVFLLAVMVFFSVVIPAAAGAAGAGLGVFLLLTIASIWKPAGDYSPAGLSGQAASFASKAHETWMPWPMITALTLSVLLVAAATLAFRRREL
jgi:ABC-2 type transport system permease protein